jgi:DNA-binding NtrC family response regulator
MQAEPMFGRAVVVFEKRPRWTPELERRFAGDNVRVRACRSTADIDVLLDAETATATVLVFDLASAAIECLHYLGRTFDRRRSVPVIVIGAGENAELEWLTREAGAIEFLPEHLGGRDLARICRRQWSAMTVG